MRQWGYIASWNDDRGFGFIKTESGDEDVFFHISDFPMGRGRPAFNQCITYDLAFDQAGRKRAKRIQLGRPRATDGSDARPRTSRVSYVRLLLIPLFAMVYLIVAERWAVPRAIGAGYLLMSLICFGAYALDKRAAKLGAWRARESRLLLLGIFGGWPGGILAQELLRHKTTKQPFRRQFSATVVLNVVVFLAVSVVPMRAVAALIRAMGIQ